METKAYMFAIRKNARWIFIVTIIGFGLGFFISKSHQSAFKSEVSLLINFERPETKGHNESERWAFSILNAVNMDRIYSLVFCDEMIQQLDSSLNLAERFGINQAKNFKSNKLKRAFISSVKLNKESENVLIIQVTHDDPDFAALLANTIALELIDLNASFAKKMIMQRANMYTSIIEELTNKSKLNSEALKNNFTEIANLSREIKNAENFRRVFEVQSKLEFAFTHFEALNQDFAKANENYLITLKAFDEYKSTSIYILNKAFPDYESESQWWIGSFTIGIASAILTFCLCCVLVYMYHANKEYISILFTRR